MKIAIHKDTAVELQNIENQIIMHSDGNHSMLMFTDLKFQKEVILRRIIGKSKEVTYLVGGKMWAYNHNGDFVGLCRDEDIEIKLRYDLMVMRKTFIDHKKALSAMEKKLKKLIAIQKIITQNKEEFSL